jgi:hypothetical protein
MRNLTVGYTRSLFARMTNSGEIPLLHVTWLDPATLVMQHLRLARYDEDVVSNGQTYTKRFFDVGYPDDSPNTDPELMLMIENIDGQVIELTRDLNNVPIFDVSIVHSDTPDTEEFGFNGKLRLLTHVDFADVLEARVEVSPAITLEPYPAQRFRVSDGFLQIR